MSNEDSRQVTAGNEEQEVRAPQPPTDLARGRPFAGTFVVSDNGRIQAVTLLAHDPPSSEGAQFLGRPLVDLALFARWPGAQVTLQAALTRAFVGEAVCADIELPATDDGPWTVIEVRLRAAWRNIDTPVVVGSLIDVTAQRWLERQLQAASRMATFGRLTCGIAQELHDRLGTITSRALTLAACAEGISDLDRLSAELVVACEHAGEFARQLTAYGREAAPIGPTIALHKTIVESQGHLRQLLGSRITLGWTFEASRDTVRIDCESLTQVLINLAANAREAMPSGGHVSVCTHSLGIDEWEAPPVPGMRIGQYVCLSFQDSGLDATSNAQANWHTAELGLALVQRTIETYGGTIIVQSGGTSGTCFRIYLPLVDDVDAVADGPPASPVLYHGTELVLLVDADSTSRLETQNLLRWSGYNVISVVDGADALALPAHLAEPPELLIVNLATYDRSRFDFVAVLRNLAPKLRVLFVGDARARRSKRKPPGAEVLWKPYTIDALLARMRQLLAD